MYDNVEDMIEFWNYSLIYLFNIHAPFKTVRISKPPAPWLTDNLKMMIKLKNKAYSKYKKVRSEATWNYYKDVRNTVNMAVKSEKKAYLKFKSKSNPKEFWKALKYLNICDKSNEENHIVDPNVFNDYFVNNIPEVINDNENNLIMEKYLNKSFGKYPKFNFSTVSVEEVEKIVRSIKSNAKGVDGIDLNMLTLVLPHLSEYLTFIINTCLTNNVFPDTWKYSNIIPVPKKNNPTDMSHFRPISILPTISKIIEKIVSNQLNVFLTEKNILPVVQSALLHVTDDIFRAGDEQKNTCLILLDYSKAFDTLNHATLCTKLKYFGLSEHACAFIHSYLINRYQRVINLADSLVG